MAVEISAMFQRILGAYTLVRPIRRLDFVVGLIVLLLAGGIAAEVLLEVGVLSVSAPLAGGGVEELVFGAFVSLVMAPLIVARLRDIGWSPYWVLVFLVASALNFDNAVILDNAMHPDRFPESLAVLGMILGPVNVLMIGTLIFYRGKSLIDVRQFAASDS